MALGDAGGGTLLVTGGVLLSIFSTVFPKLSIFFPFCFPKQCEPKLPRCSSAGPCPLPLPGAGPGWCLMAWP